MDRLTSLEVFVEVVERGSFSRAAEFLGISATMASTHVTRLEQRVGKRLLERTTRRMDLTREGRAYFEEVRRLLAGIRAAEEAVRGTTTPRGRVTIAAPSSLGRQYVLPQIKPFRDRFPEVSLDVSLGDRWAVVRPDDVDVMLRVGEPGSADSATYVLGHTRLIAVASPDYLARRGTPETPANLVQHDCIAYGAPERPGGHRWRFIEDGRPQWRSAPAVLSLNDGRAITAAACAGVGVALNLEMLMTEELADRRLVTLFPELESEPLPVCLTSPVKRGASPAVQATIDFLRALDWNLS